VSARGPGSCAVGTPASDRGAPGAATLAASLLARVARVLRQVAGAPDYAAYLEHMDAHHPGAAVLTEPEFHRRAMDRLDGSSRPRCC
jgi:uncharacterized short protein YbdD (DUF466 family)